MIILPAIDIKDGCCVRLRKGDFSTAHKVAEDAGETAATKHAAVSPASSATLWAVEKSPFRRRTQQPSLMSIAGKMIIGTTSQSF